MTEKEFEKLLKELSPKVRDAFIAAIADLTDGADLEALIDALEREDIDEVLDLLNLSDAVFSDLREELRAAFNEAGGLQMKDFLTGAAAGLAAWALSLRRVTQVDVTHTRVTKLTVRFDIHKQRAEREVRKLAAPLAKDVVSEARKNARAVVRDGLKAGKSPRQISRDLIGVRDRAAGRRVGGVLGLTENQKQWADNAEEELSGDVPDEAYFNRQRRDRRYDSAVRKAIREGKPLDATMKTNIVRRYRDRLLQQRGEVVSRTETIAAMNAGRHESAQQLVDSGEVDQDEVYATWSTSRDQRVRDQHVAMEGQRRKIGDPFIAPDGSRLRFPGDRGLGATAANLLGCRCYVPWVVDWIEWARRRDA